MQACRGIVRYVKQPAILVVTVPLKIGGTLAMSDIYHTTRSAGINRKRDLSQKNFGLYTLGFWRSSRGSGVV